jgi:hypothetical protein
MKNTAFRDVTPCGSCKNWRFGRTYRFHHQGDRNRRARSSCLLLLTFLARRFLSPWWWRRHVPPQRRFLQEPHGLTSQKVTFFNLCYTFASASWKRCPSNPVGRGLVVIVLIRCHPDWARCAREVSSWGKEWGIPTCIRHPLHSLPCRHCRPLL